MGSGSAAKLVAGASAPPSTATRSAIIQAAARRRNAEAISPTSLLVAFRRGIVLRRASRVAPNLQHGAAHQPPGQCPDGREDERRKRCQRAAGRNLEERRPGAEEERPH